MGYFLNDSVSHPSFPSLQINAVIDGSLSVCSAPAAGALSLGELRLSAWGCAVIWAMAGRSWHTFSLSTAHSACLRLKNTTRMSNPAFTSRMSNPPFHCEASWQLDLHTEMSPAEMAAATSLVQCQFSFDMFVEPLTKFLQQARTGFL